MISELLFNVLYHGYRVYVNWKKGIHDFQGSTLLLCSTLIMVQYKLNTQLVCMPSFNSPFKKRILIEFIESIDSGCHNSKSNTNVVF